MQRFAFFKNSDGPGYLLNIQSDLLTGLTTRVVVPLLPLKMDMRINERLHPVFRIADKDFVMATHLMTAVPLTVLSYEAGQLNHEHDRIIAALDMLFSGI